MRDGGARLVLHSATQAGRMGAEDTEMATLHVRNVPDELYQRLKELAGEDETSLSAEVIRLLEVGVERHPREVRRLLEWLRQERERDAAEGLPVLDPVALIREGRDR